MAENVACSCAGSTSSYIWSRRAPSCATRWGHVEASQLPRWVAVKWKFGQLGIYLTTLHRQRRIGSQQFRVGKRGARLGAEVLVAIFERRGGKSRDTEPGSWSSERPSWLETRIGSYVSCGLSGMGGA